ncbi:hypothetical protein C8D92_108158 [Tamilnaduibacter salinus]|uniref:PIN domain-containing protein n=1 Tax=Tamilnaduibacter salinus TaxID=1484056 RepID=A0A2U1CV03_9GAMM|nr:type II toxin-antitoxin system VapC family toxin [Tamilnaduibacter salinus]PVY70801.1 hypothetical protein C8D92_108158 [Tamilnaduibacter salinus]
MTGRYFLDTNAWIYAINGRVKLPGYRYFTSVITEMELLSWPALTASEERVLRDILTGIHVIGLTSDVKDRAIEIRKATSLKLPDSIVSASAQLADGVLVTNDRKLRERHGGASVTLEELLEQSSG